MAFLNKVNIDLLVPLLIVFMFLRLKTVYSFPHKLLSGLRFFISKTILSQKHLRAPQSASSSKNQSIIDKKLQDFNLSMIELDGSVRKGSILSDILLFDVYDTLVYLSLCSVVVHFFSYAFHCFSPASEHSIWGTLFVAVSVIYPFRALMRILGLTGFEAFESRVALIVFAISFMGSAALLFCPFDILGLSLNDVLTVTATHFNALLLQLSETAIQLSEPVMVATIKMWLSFVISMTAIGMVIPAMRFAQSFNTLLFGVKLQKASPLMQGLLVIDHFLPLLVAILMIPNGLRIVGGELSSKYNGYWLAAQLLATVTMTVVRLSCLTTHIQCFLDTVVTAISVEIVTNNTSDAKDIQDKVAARYNYIPAAAVQYISVPLVALGLALLTHKASPYGTGICVDIRSALGMDSQAIISAAEAALSYNATSAALLMTSNGEPSLMSGLHLFLMSAGEGGVSPTSQLRAFIVRLTSTLYLLPVGAFVALGRAAICVHCFLWFTISSSSIVYWYFTPQKKVTGDTLKKDE